jgi:hypothetical protein
MVWLHLGNFSQTHLATLAAATQLDKKVSVSTDRES